MNFGIIGILVNGLNELFVFPNVGFDYVSYYYHDDEPHGLRNEPPISNIVTCTFSDLINVQQISWFTTTYIITIWNVTSHAHIIKRKTWNKQHWIRKKEPDGIGVWIWSKLLPVLCPFQQHSKNILLIYHFGYRRPTLNFHPGRKDDGRTKFGICLLMVKQPRLQIWLPTPPLLWNAGKSGLWVCQEVCTRMIRKVDVKERQGIMRDYYGIHI